MYALIEVIAKRFVFYDLITCLAIIFILFLSFFMIIDSVIILNNLLNSVIFCSILIMFWRERA